MAPVYMHAWKLSYEDEARMQSHTWRCANTHPHTQLTPQRCMGPLLNRLSAHHLHSSHYPSTNIPSMNPSFYFKMQKAKQQKHTHFVAAASLTPSSWLWRENGGPLRSEWLRLHYPVKAVVLVTERFIETHFFFTQACIRADVFFTPRQ